MRTILNKISNMPIWAALAIILSSHLLVMIGFGMHLDIKFFLFFIPYMLFGTLVLITTGWRVFQWGVSFVDKRPWVKTLLSNKALTDRISFVCSTFMNLISVFIYIYAGSYYRATWFYALALYYGILSGARIYSVVTQAVGHFKTDENIKSQHAISGFTRSGYTLLLLCVPVLLMVILVVFEDKSKGYNWFIVYFMMFFACYFVIRWVIRMIKERKADLLYRTQAYVNMASSLVFMYSVQTALLHYIGTHLSERKIWNLYTGLGVLLIIAGMGIYMILKGKYLEKITPERC